LSDEEKRAAVAAEPQIVKHCDWKDHVGIKDNIEIVRIIDLIYGLISTMDHIVNLIYFVHYLVTVQNTQHTTIFLLVSSIVIINYQWAIPLLLLIAAVKLLHNNYKCLRYSHPPPNVSQNINFVALLAEWSMANRYIVD
jgi:hypothetical protein